MQARSELSSHGTLPPGVIVNADDLAIHPDISAGIMSAYRHGIVSSTSLLVTTPYLERTIGDCVRPTGIPVGIHLSLTYGRAIAPAGDVPDLIDQAGNLKLSPLRLLLGLPARVPNARVLEQIRREFKAQLSLAKDYGLTPTHVDSHQHVHMNPIIFDLVQDLAPFFGVHAIRLAREPAWSLSLAVSSEGARRIDFPRREHARAASRAIVVDLRRHGGRPAGPPVERHAGTAHMIDLQGTRVRPWSSPRAPSGLLHESSP